MTDKEEPKCNKCGSKDRLSLLEPGRLLWCKVCLTNHYRWLDTQEADRKAKAEAGSVDVDKVLERAHADREQFVAMKVAEAWETYEEMLPDDPEDPTEPVPWEIYKRATEKIAGKLWMRNLQREKKKAKRTVSLEDLRSELADPKDHLAELVAADLADAMMRVLTDHQRRVLSLSKGRSHTEVSSLMGISELAVKRALERARAVIRGTFAD